MKYITMLVCLLVGLGATAQKTPTTLGSQANTANKSGSAYRLASHSEGGIINQDGYSISTQATSITSKT